MSEALERETLNSLGENKGPHGIWGEAEPQLHTNAWRPEKIRVLGGAVSAVWNPQSAQKAGSLPLQGG